MLEPAPAPLVGKERQLRDRNSQLSIPNKSFKQVLELLHMAQREHASWRNAAKAKAVPPPKVFLLFNYSGVCSSTESKYTESTTND